jgi:hypothetical protein
MFNRTSSWISLATTKVFHPLTSRKSMRLHIRLHKILGNIRKLIKLK